MRHDDIGYEDVSPRDVRHVIAVSGVKNSGKTTLIEKLVSLFSKDGKKVAVIKHDGHDFECDIPGTDSYRMTAAGAYGAAVYSSKRMFVHRIGTGEKERELLELFPEADIIFLEGLKDSSYPKIEIVRSEISKEPVSNPEGRFLIATDLETSRFAERAVDLNDISAIKAVIEREIL